MGLDLYHFLATNDRSNTPIVIDPEAADLQILKPYFHQLDNQYIDWEAMFAARGMAAGDFVMTRRTMQASESLLRWGKIEETYEFCLRADDGVSVSFTSAPEPLLKLPFRKQPSNIFRGSFLFRTRRDTVISVVEAGYQRDAVADEFYSEFPPDLVTADFSRVERIAELTLPEAQPEFRRSFVENWRPGASLLGISW